MKFGSRDRCYVVDNTGIGKNEKKLHDFAILLLFRGDRKVMICHIISPDYKKTIINLESEDDYKEMFKFYRSQTSEKEYSKALPWMLSQIKKALDMTEEEFNNVTTHNFKDYVEEQIRMMKRG